MRGRDFLLVARELASGTAEPHWRAAAIHSYYALFLECRDTLASWHISISRHSNVHAAVRLRFVYASDLDLKDIGDALDWLVLLRNKASYDLSAGVSQNVFRTSAQALVGVQRASDALSLLDALDADPVRRAAAVASFPP